ncbi:Uncharacterised protein [Collinsella sp. AK_207A]|uniref:type II toxin-antitoxin system RelB family antitoxin n=1 Tax=Collinsella sp. AK_207A TaxID=2650472 RepID=UPI0012612276|nr:DUF6290 family protein [Collinsella sp. AK_207A]VWM04301.1 Uncharacterised protein [Collinsella sp. AK_207A]
MTTMTLRMDDADAEVVRKYAAFEGVSISDFLRDAVFEKIEGSQDLADLRAAAAADDGVRFSLSDVKSELGL